MSKKTGTHTEKEPKESVLKTLKPRTINQKKYFDSIDKNIITICEGPAGSGKTVCAVYKAAELLYNGKISKIILTRPVIETGESLGFLPGTIEEKMNPYLRPLFDCLSKVLPLAMVRDLLAKGIIEICPFAFMRGRDFSECVIIADEVQNACEIQIKMLLTRLAENSKLILTADLSQVDVPDSGYENIIPKLKNIPDIGLIELELNDIQRLPVVKAILIKLGE